MRWILSIIIIGTLGIGCRTDRATAPVEGEPLWTEDDDTHSATKQAEGQAEETVIIPITSSTGIVAQVNEPLRFVVLDYALTGLPEMDQILFLYRRGQKVARVKVTGPVRGQTIAADIIEGIAEKGDEVRPD